MKYIESDVTIVGAGIAGICAAISAARHGLKVALVHNRPVPGGNASSEVGVQINGAATNGLSPSVYAREGGIIEELKLTIHHYYAGYKNNAALDAAYFDLLYRETGISLFLNTDIYDVCMSGNYIKAVIGRQLGSETEFRFESPLFIDSSGDGFVGYKAGASCMWGREGRQLFNESLAPVNEDKHVLGDTLLFWSRDTGKTSVFQRPEFAYDITKLNFFKNLDDKTLHRTFYRSGKEFNGLWWVEYGGHLDTIHDNEQITLELRKLIYGIWDYIKNSGKFDDVDSLVLERVAPIAGKRESRRFIGDYILTQNDIDHQKEFTDTVCIGGWPMDVHAPYGIYDEGPATCWYKVPGIYGIPFRCLYSKNIKNLMLAGRNASATHIAFGSTRVMATCGCMGQAVGTAAYLAKKYNVLPGQMGERHIDELLDTLQYDDQTIPGREEKWNKMILEGCTVTASSTRKFSCEQANTETKLDQSVCLVLPVMTQTLDSVDIKVRNDSSEASILHIEFYSGIRSENYCCENKKGETNLQVQGNYDGWLRVPVNCEISCDRKIFIVFNKQKDLTLYSFCGKLPGVVSLGYYKESPLETCVGYLDTLKLDSIICFNNVQPEQDIFSVKNLFNGYSRPYGLPNIWISEEAAEVANQYIDIILPSPRNIMEVHLIFNTGLDEDNTYRNIPELIKDYIVTFTDNKGRSSCFEVQGNFLRLRKHIVNVKNVTGIRIGFKATNGSPTCEVYGIKLY